SLSLFLLRKIVLTKVRTGATACRTKNRRHTTYGRIDYYYSISVPEDCEFNSKKDALMPEIVT
ncbi:MAG: hypothetical protein SCJ93_09570, partial [Bacillota bacterium]|nr:hypothetical protein [Bacillota bacterium]